MRADASALRVCDAAHIGRLCVDTFTARASDSLSESTINTTGCA